MRTLNYFFKSVFIFSMIFFTWFLQDKWLILNSDQVGLMGGLMLITLFGLCLLFHFDIKDDSAEE